MKTFAFKSVATAVGVGISGVAAAKVNFNGANIESYRYASAGKVDSKGADLGDNQVASMKVGEASRKDTTAYDRFDPSKGSFKSNPTLVPGADPIVTDAVTGGSTNPAVFAIKSSLSTTNDESGTLTARDVTRTGNPTTIHVNRTGPPPPVIILDRQADAGLSMTSKSVAASAFMMGMDQETGEFHAVLRVESLTRLQEFARTLLAEVDAQIAAGGRQDVPVALHLSRSLLGGAG
jgi:hypothetical protein